MLKSEIQLNFRKVYQMSAKRETKNSEPRERQTDGLTEAEWGRGERREERGERRDIQMYGLGGLTSICLLFSGFPEYLQL